MKPSMRWLVGLAVALAISILAVLAFAAAVQGGFLRETFVHLVATRIGRPVSVGGALRIELFSWNPRITAERVVIENPHWMSPGRMAEIGALSLIFDMPRPHHRFGVNSLSMHAADLHLVRDAAGRANWQWDDPSVPQPNKKLAIVRTLDMPEAHVSLDDDRRHLKFEGRVSAEALPGAPAVKISGEGELNGRPATFEITSDSLASASHERPYHFSYTERSSGSRLEGQGNLPRPFDFDAIQTAFEASGEDLADLYYLVGVHMLNTGKYRLAGKLEREGLRSDFSELSVHSGQSDIHGSISVDSTRDRAHLDFKLASRLLRTADIGLAAAGRAPPDPGPPLVLSKATFSPASLRPDDAAITLHFAEVELAHLKLQNVAAKGLLDHGVLTAQSLTAGVLGGEAQASGTLDANHDPPLASVDLKIAGLELGQLHHKAGTPPPIEGALRARIVVKGRGTSIHQVAATADGIVTLAVPHGTVRDSLAELAGKDLRALGLMMAKDEHDTSLRCAAGIFQARDGTLSTQRFVADTEPVYITGSGLIQFDTESLDLQLRGEPKSVRLFHWRSPLLIKGTLAHPSIDVHARKLEIIDRGVAKDADCASLIESADAANARSPAAPSH